MHEDEMILLTAHPPHGQTTAGIRQGRKAIQLILSLVYHDKKTGDTEKEMINQCDGLKYEHKLFDIPFDNTLALECRLGLVTCFQQVESGRSDDAWYPV